MIGGLMINGDEHDHGSLEFTIDGFPVSSVESVNWESSGDSADRYGTSRTPQASTLGTVSHSADFEIPLSVWTNVVIPKLAALALGRGYMAARFDITLTFGSFGMPPTRVEIRGCRVTGDSGGSSQGADPSKRTINLRPLQIKTNGELPLV